jgi:hypothetical protein
MCDNGNKYAGKKYTWMKEAGPGHAWMDHGEFIDELREKLPPFIKGRIAEWQKKYAEKEAAFSARIIPYRKKRDELQAAYNVYLNEGLPRDVKKKKQRAVRSLLGDVVGSIIGVLIGFLIIHRIFHFFDLLKDLSSLGIPIPFIILPMIVAAVFFLGKRVVQFLKACRYAESQGFTDELAHEWRNNNGLNEMESNIEAEKDEWNNWSESWKRIVYSAERALAGSDEELLNYYNTDQQAKNWYIKNIYDDEW